MNIEYKKCGNCETWQNHILNHKECMRCEEITENLINEIIKEDDY